MHVIAAKAVAFKEALTDDFKEYQRQIVKNSKVFAQHLTSLGYRIVTGGTDNHLFMVDVSKKNITGKEAAELLDQVHITVNKNLIPFDPQPPAITSGLRIGTPALTTRGMKEDAMKIIAELIDEAITQRNDLAALKKVEDKVFGLAQEYPIYPDLKY